MRAFREADTNKGVNILSQTEFNTISATTRSSDVLYIIAEFVSGSTTHVHITDVWIGNQSQNLLLDSTGAIAWVGNRDNTESPLVAISGFTNPVATTGSPINNLV